MDVYLLLSFYCLLYVVIKVSLLLVVHVCQPESTALCASTCVLPDQVVTTQFSLRLLRSLPFHNWKLTQDLISHYQIKGSIYSTAFSWLEA